MSSSPARTRSTRTARFELLPEGIVLGVQSTADQTRADAEENIRALEALLAGSRAPLVMDLRQLERGLPPEARDVYMGPPLAALVSAVAFSGAGVLTRMLVNTVMMVGRVAGNTLPMKMFDRHEDALAWARTYLRR